MHKDIYMQVTEQFTMQVGDKVLHHGKCVEPLCSHACLAHAFILNDMHAHHTPDTLRDMHAHHTPPP